MITMVDLQQGQRVDFIALDCTWREGGGVRNGMGVGGLPFQQRVLDMDGGRKGGKQGGRKRD
jgi:hypothetical protein